MRFAHDQRHFLDDAMLAIDLLGQFLENLHMAFLSRLGRRALCALARLGRQGVEHRPLVDAVIPDFEIAHLGEAADALAVGTHDRTGGIRGDILVASHETRRHDSAGRQTL
jgi:hypothetical protein